MSLERGRKIEDLQKRLIESESLRNKYNRKISLLKEHVRTTGETIDTERNINEQSLQFLRDELAKFKQNLSDVQRKEAQLQNFKHSIAKILGVSSLIPDYELISRYYSKLTNIANILNKKKLKNCIKKKLSACFPLENNYSCGYIATGIG